MTDKQLALLCDEGEALCALWVVQHQKRATLSAISSMSRALGLHCDSRRTASAALRRLRRKGVVEVAGKGWRVVKHASPETVTLLRSTPATASSVDCPDCYRLSFLAEAYLAQADAARGETQRLRNLVATCASCSEERATGGGIVG